VALNSPLSGKTLPIGKLFPLAQRFGHFAQASIEHFSGNF
jgi:hypothetical protein